MKAEVVCGDGHGGCTYRGRQGAIKTAVIIIAAKIIVHILKLYCPMWIEHVFQSAADGPSGQHAVFVGAVRKDGHGSGSIGDCFGQIAKGIACPGEATLGIKQRGSKSVTSAAGKITEYT